MGNNLYLSPDVVRQIKSRRMRWAEHVAHMGGREKYTRSWWESLKERDHSENGGIGGRMGPEWILRRLAGTVWDGFTLHRIGTGGRLFLTLVNL
jgi:hypothetical protein